MKKILLFFSILSISFTSVKAQSQSSVKASIGFDAGIPLGVYDAIYNYTLGASLKIEMPLQPSFSLMFTTGYTSFMVNSYYGNYGVANGMYLPLEIGGRGYFTPKAYFEADLGPSFNLNSVYTGNKVEFMYSPAVGFILPDAQGGAFDLAVRYEGRAQTGATLGQLALRVAYRFK